MISAERLSITPHHNDLPKLELAPFTADDLGQYIPFSDDYKRHSPVDPKTNEQYSDQRTPEEIISDCEQRKHFLTWGIFVGSKADGDFVGSVAVSGTNTGTKEEPEWNTVMQEIHTGILSDQWRGRGIGTLSKLAVASYTFDQGQTLALYAYTSPHNIAAHGSLFKAGFSHVNTFMHLNYRDQEMTTYWMLATPFAQKNLPEDQEMLVAGWDRYQAARQLVAIDYKEA